MSPATFRQIALSLPETEERQHMNHPDFRVARKIFATLGYPDKRCGATSVYVDDAQKEIVQKALDAAWRNNAPRRLLHAVRMREN